MTPGPARKGNTPPRSIRVPDDVWQAAKARAEAEGTTTSEAVVRYLRRWGKGKGKS